MTKVKKKYLMILNQLFKIQLMVKNVLLLLMVKPILVKHIQCKELLVIREYYLEV